MKLMATSDWHADAITAGVPRYGDVTRAVDMLLHEFEARECKAFVFLGDLCNPDTVRSHRAIAFAVGVARRIDGMGCESLWLTGNHDVIEDGTGAHTLLALVAAAHGTVIDRPRADWLGGKLSVLGLPYTARSHAYDPEAFVVEAKAAGVEPALVLGHLNIEGIAPGSETSDMPRGRDVFLPLDAIRAAWPDALVLNGHYHQRQEFRGVHIPGSLERLTFGEEQNEPGFLIVEVG